MRVYFKEQPRTLLLATDDFALSFQCVSVDNKDRVLVDFASRDSIDFQQYRALSSLPCYGCLGLISIDSDVFLAVITGSSKVAEPVEALETVFRIHALEFYCISRSNWDFVVLDPAGNPLDIPTADIDVPTQTLEHPCAALRKLLTDGSFYYSNDFDLTNRMQARSAEPTFDIDGFDDTFMWNSFMISELVTYRSRLQDEEKRALDNCRFLTSVIRGFAETVPTRLDRIPATLTVISRQGCRRAGTRYNARGVDDEGNVANFVETETILYTSDFSFSYTQIRGSVPNVQLLSAKVNITRAFEATQPAFMAHFEPLVAKYGPVHIVNLLSTKPGEHELTQRYHQHIKQASQGVLQDQLRETRFDFHVETAKSGYTAANRILRFLQEDAEEFGYFLFDSTSKAMLLEQTGVFRTNCLDCLDRTNLIQQIISRLALETLLEHKEIRPGNDLWVRHSVLWADNGDQLSKIYAGTGALKTSFTRSGKMSIAGAIADATKSVSRMYINNFVDKGKQNTMDMLLGRLEGQERVVLHDPINDYVMAELNKLKSQFTSTKEISVLVGTFNLNGLLYEGDLSSWLFPENSGIDDPDLVIVGFQEIVELTPGQILSADPAKRQFWERQVSRNLNKGDREYVLLRSGQLVGTALLMYVKKSEVRHVRNINGAMKKTGLGGMAGNKGGVAFSCDYASTKLCFITSHLAAGLSNVEDRNNDFRTISRGIRFPRGKRPKDHDTVIWLGDFNYRIDMQNDDVRQLIKQGNLEELYKNDQLNKQMLNGQVFPFFSEAPITFNPTYKYDNNTDEYDTSDKARIPAWTDRILVRGTNVRQVSYGCGTLRFSDHRPVYATYRITVYTVNEPLKEKLSQELYAKRRGSVGQLLVDVDTGKLPPPSTDRQKWWNDGGQSSKIAISPKPGMVLNPHRPANPFSQTTEPEFIKPPPVPHKPTSLSSMPPALPPRRQPTELVETPLQTFRGDDRPSPTKSRTDFPSASLSKIRSATYTSPSASMSVSSSNDARFPITTITSTKTELPPKLPPRPIVGQVRDSTVSPLGPDGVYGPTSPVRSIASSRNSPQLLDEEDDAKSLNSSWKALA